MTPKAHEWRVRYQEEKVQGFETEEKADEFAKGKPGAVVEKRGWTQKENAMRTSGRGIAETT